MKLKNTYPKILLLIFSSSIFFILLYFSLYYYTKQVEKQVYTSTEFQYNNEVNMLLQLENKPIQVALNNDTNWDEFVDFTKTNNKQWYDETIGNELDIYKADYLGTYDVNKKFMIRTASNRLRSTDIIPKHAMDQLDEVGTTKFYLLIPEGLAEVTGASIHPSDDPLKKKTKPFGYFFVARLIDQKYIGDFKKIASSEIKFINTDRAIKKENHTIYATVNLQDCFGNTIGRLQFERKFDVYFENMLNILYLIFVVFVINILINLFYTRKLVYLPLDLITRVLETGEKKAIKELKATHGEFRNIGLLFEENNNQKHELVKAKLKAEESDRLKSSFLANLSHEIRTPMNAISGFTDLMLNTQLSHEEQIEYLKVVDKSGRNLVSIIDDLIEMSKIDSNQISPNYTQVDLEACVSELFETIRITIPKSKPVELFVVPAREPLAYPIIADETKLKQVLVNLVTNGIKYTDKGTVSFGYELNEKKKEITFSIYDTGPGIDAKNQKFIFDRFKRIENDASIKAGGLGLGLAITKAYVEMMGGSITLKSEVGKGSVFSFTLPLQYAEVQKISVKQVKSRKSSEHESFTILIAEDDNINYLLFQKIIQSRNYNIIRAVNGLEAVEISLSNPDIDLVLMDIKMPIMNGFEALEKVKAIRPELFVVAQTAYASSDDEERIIKAGFYGYLTKPINREKLFEMIDQVQKNKKSDR
ncbi:response regulator [Flavobacterium sp. CYK-55]|uniref:ATP-binding protein n=1 Tax=Flavobacterium sp. CYK-55 TaxID=2835529 RepID=UPI001BCCE716|nr:ATP-binding protein [Flavobacterium sp. CYK-55]MBS7786251.1 response regulator [Flavobacterium sp. CYK-55]